MKTANSQRDLVLTLIDAAEALHHSGWLKQAADLKHWAWKLERREVVMKTRVGAER